MTDKLDGQKPYERWLAECREVSPSATLADQVMSQVVDFEHQRRNIWWLRLIQRIEHSRAARWTVCSGALAIGGSPFVFLAHVAKFVTF
jgi:hypothetical protein